MRFDPEAGYRALLQLAENPSSVSLHEVLARVAAIEEQLDELRDVSGIWMMVQQCQRLLFDSLGLRFAATPDALERCFFEAASEFERIEGIQRCLTGLRARGLRLGVVSNYPETGESLRSVLSRLEIADPFEFVVSSADYGIGKPHPLIFETAMAKLGVDGSTTWFVGDTLELDIAGANEAGLFSVWYNPNEKESNGIEPNATIKSWEEFEGLIGTMG